MRVALLLFAGCTLGGTGRPPGAGDQGSSVDHVACVTAMAGAPLAPAGFDYHDALPVVVRNAWDPVSMPQPGDTTYPGGHCRTLAPDSSGAIHPGCTTDGLMCTPASIPGYACAGQQISGEMLTTAAGRCSSPRGSWSSRAQPNRPVM